MNKKPEQRIFNLSEIKIEQREEGKPPAIIGHAAVFNEQTEIWWFKEEIMPGAFKNALKKSDTRALFNHDPNWILGRNKAGTLKLKEDDNGLAVEIMPPETQLVKDMVLTPMERGDLSQMSFAFTVKEEQWTEKKDEMPIRSIVEVDELFDVSVVTYPAYPTTDAKLRSAKEVYDEHLKEVAKRESDTKEEQEKQDAIKRKQIEKDLQLKDLQIKVKQ